VKCEPKVKPVRAWAMLCHEAVDAPYICWADEMFWSKREAVSRFPSERWIRVEIRPAPKRRKVRKAKRS